MIGIFINLWNRLVGAGGAAISYVLDEYSGAAAAYSLRKLSSTYGGSAVRVRRASDNAEQDIGFVGQDLDETALMNFVGYQNLVQRSEEFGDAIWVKGNASISANSTTAPNGTLTADTFIETAVNSFHQLTNSVTTISGQTYTFSVYAKQAAGTRFIGLQPVGAGGAGNNQTATFDLVNGTFLGNIVAPGGGSGVGTPFDSTNTSIQSVGNGWYRISCTTTVTGTSYALAIALLNSFSTAGLSYLGDGTSGVFLWGAQLNAGVSAQPYQVTTSAARSGDGFVTKWYTQDSNWENLFLQSQTFDSINWSKNTSTATANAGTDPFGGNNATRWLSNVGSTTHFILQTLSLSAGASYTLSFYVKSNTGSNQLFRLFGCNTILTSDFTATTEWQRFSFSFIATSSTQHGITRPASNAAVDLLIYGAQLSQSTWLQPYNPTTTTAILRRDASQSTAANQPRIVGGGVIERENGKPTMFFDGVNDHFVGTDIALPVWSIFSTAVNTIPSATTSSIYNRGTSAAGNSTRDALLYLNTVNKAVDAQRSDNSVFPTSRSYTSIQNYLVASGIFTGSQITAFADSVAGASTSTSITGSVSPVTLIGATNETATQKFFMGGEIGEVIVYNSDRTATRADIERNLGAYYQTHWTGASSGLLDQFGGAAAAYSLRNLSSSYRGPLIRVRRSSDNAETDIGGTYNGDLDVASLLSFTGGQNLMLYSQDFSTSWFTARGSVTANTTIAPDGTLTADSVICNTTSPSGLITLYVVTSPATTITEFTGSCYIKAGNRGFAGLVIYDDISAGCRQYFNLITGQLGSDNFFGTGVTKVSASIQNVGNGWFRCSLTVRYKVSSNIQLLVLPAIQADTVLACTVGDFGYIWGAQLNTGILQPYIPTTTTAVNGANAFVTKWYTQNNNYQNLVLQSQTFENASWVKNASSVSVNTTTDPIGGSTGETLFETVDNDAHFLSQSNALSAGTYTFSISLKYLNTKYVQLNINNSVSSGAGVVFDVELASYVGNSSVGTGYTVQSYSISPQVNGWYRYSVTVTTSGIAAPAIALRNSNTLAWNNIYAGLTSVGVYIWGAQVNEGSVAQPYTATTTTVSQRRDAIQATAANQPRIVNAGGVESEGNRPALFFDGTDDNLSVPNGLSVLQDVGYANGFSVASNNSSAVGYRTVYNVSVNPTANTRAGMFINGTVYETGGRRLDADAYQSVSGGSVDTVPKILSSIIQYATSDAYLYLNNNLIASSTSFLTDGNTSNTTSNEYKIGVGGTAFWSGDIQEMVLYNTNQFSSRPTIESNANSYYRIYWQGNGTALLDNFSGASAAYSLRNLSSAYTGPLIRVRRSSDNVERDIYGTFGGDLDIASLVAFVGANSGFVTRWYDQSGNARHATQATAGNQPRIVNAGVVDTLNGKPSLFFDGAGDVLDNAGVTSSSWTLLSVVNVSAGSAYGGIYTSSSFSGFMYHKSVGGYGYRISSDYNALFGDVSGNQSLFIDINGNLGSMYVNQVAGFVDKTLLGVSSVTLFRVFGAWAGFTFGGNAQEFIIYNSSLPSIRTGTQSNINNYYKIY